MQYSLVKVFWFFVHPIKRIYWYIFRPKTRGVKCLIEKDSKFLLVKLNYAKRKWTFPGGGVKKRESFLEAAIRETKEEAGVDVINPVFIGSYESRIEYKHDTVEVYLGSTERLELKVDPIEVEQAAWFSRNELPENHSNSVDKIFNFYDEFRSIKN